MFLNNLADDALEKITPTLTKATESCSKQIANATAIQKNMAAMMEQHIKRMNRNEEISHESYLKYIREDTLQAKNDTKQILENQKYLTNGIYALKKTAASIENKSGIMLAAIELFKSRLITPNYKSTPTKKPLALEG